MKVAHIPEILREDLYHIYMGIRKTCILKFSVKSGGASGALKRSIMSKHPLAYSIISASFIALNALPVLAQADSFSSDSLIQQLTRTVEMDLNYGYCRPKTHPGPCQPS